NTNEIFFVYKILQSYPQCKFLIFGMGNDSPLWASLNKNGRTVFLENDNDWFVKLKKIFPCLEAYLVQYLTKMSDWKVLMGQPEKLYMDLPKGVKNEKWDVILVDGPPGYEGYREIYGVEAPGRMSSIYMASKLISPKGDIFVHDCDREIESEYCDKYYGKEKFKNQINGRALLKHYKMNISE
ncbi:MAG: TIGR01627 domain-containing protein, partial [Candidatus Paceibacterales bacterium]